MKALNIPVGISNFEKIRNNGFYYVDKTGLIEELLKTEAEVTLITRPRRFGKTLGMSMLESFFDFLNVFFFDSSTPMNDKWNINNFFNFFQSFKINICF